MVVLRVAPVYAPGFQVMSHDSFFLTHHIHRPFLFLRLTGVAFHLAAFITVALDKHRMIQEALPRDYSPSEYDEVRHYCNAALALMFLCWFAASWGIKTAVTIRNPAMNLVHAACHITAGILLMCVWNYSGHYVRIWHIQYFFGYIPTALELAYMYCAFQRGYLY
jgi:hypothetical protein